MCTPSRVLGCIYRVQLEEFAELKQDLEGILTDIW